MTSLLDRCRDRPRRRVAAGSVVIAEGSTERRLLIVAAGTFVVSRNGQRVATVSEEGSVLGEMSVLLDRPATATVSAGEAGGELVEIDDPASFLTANPDALLDVARMLATRLDAATSYLADLGRQYGPSAGNLGLIGEVLTTLTMGPPRTAEPGSEREPDPEY
ncbi:MAG: cyclic nucleotide-binding domain-containing protein [Actinomycetota bacterium]